VVALNEIVRAKRVVMLSARLGRAPAGRARQTQKFPFIFLCGSPQTPRRKAERGEGNFWFAPPLHSFKRARK